MNNTVETKSIIQLRDSRTFYIPAYQRGYRWNKAQVDDLLDDLYSFINKRDKTKNEFYCLQPIIVKEVSVTEKTLQNIEIKDSLHSITYEVIDGQQRLTTLYILLRYLICNFTDEEDRVDEFNNLYQLNFQTRKDIHNYLYTIEKQTSYQNIDEKHAYDAYQWIEQWLESKKTNTLRKGDIARKLTM